jgi:Winged helix-turn-helix domain (DUF2582)
MGTRVFLERDFYGRKETAMQEEIGITAGVIWQALNTNGEMSLAALKKEVNGKAPIIDWAIGWLAREDKIIVTREKRSYIIRLKEAQTKAAGA